MKIDQMEGLKPPTLTKRKSQRISKANYDEVNYYKGVDNQRKNKTSDLSCRECHRILKDKHTLAKHEINCLQLNNGESFFKYDNAKKTCDFKDKILPLSQPLDLNLQSLERPGEDKIVQELVKPLVISFQGNEFEIIEKDAYSYSMISTDAEKSVRDEIIQKDASSSSLISTDAEKSVWDENSEHSTTSSGIAPLITASMCKFCNEMFKNKRGLGLHQRHCKSKPSIILVEGSSANQNDSQSCDHNYQNNLLSLGIPLTRKVWGDHCFEDLLQICNSMYDEVVFWRKNLFKLPSGAAGKQYIREMTRLIEIWNEQKLPVSDISLKLLMVMPAVLLQKPYQNSKSKLHSEYLKKRLILWENGRFDELMREARTIQGRLKLHCKIKMNTPEHTAKTFANLMLLGKVNAALRLLDKDSSLGIANLTDDTMKELKKLHPDGKHAGLQTLMTGELPYFDPVIFQNIDESSIAKAAHRTRGAAGPSGLDADGWRRILISKNYGNIGKDLRSSIAKMTQNLCTREVKTGSNNNRTSIEAYTACRLIPLKKEPTGIRPIGIGEVLRRIIGKAIIVEIKPDIMESAGSLQLCAGQKAGCEASAHAMKEIFEEEETDAVLFIDASNAFNSLNRVAMLHNLQYLCPQMATYVKNCYGTPSRLFVAGGKELKSDEGTTQGDPLAMHSYGVGILPFLSIIKPELQKKKMKHVAYADDIGGGSGLLMLRSWWNKIVENGPDFGYFPKASKTWLVVKEEKLNEAEELFRDTGIQITTEGRKYLGGFIGTQEGRENYVKQLVDEWMSQLSELSIIAKSEPQAAYSAFTAGFKHKLTYFIRTIPNIKDMLSPLDDIIDNKLIPALTEGQIISHEDRKLLSIPVRLGGLGIPIFSKVCEEEYHNSRKATVNLVKKIVDQDETFTQNKNLEKEIELEIRKEREKGHNELLEILRTRMSKEKIRGNDVARMKGASAWLTALPLKDEGFYLNKREFFDALALRYRWQLKRLPLNCACGKRFDMDHAMSCLKGGYIHQRHDRLRDMFAALIDDVAHSTQVEPMLQPLSGENIPLNANREDDARLDIAARSFWQQCEMAFFDVRVFNPFAKSHLARNLEAVFRSNESSKKTAYNTRVIQIEHGSFTPLVFSSFGGYGKETSCFLSKLVGKIAHKFEMEKSAVANYIRSKISFELIRSQVACIRGARSLKKIVIDTSEMEVLNSSITE